jgi:hypothetical protein
LPCLRPEDHDEQRSYGLSVDWMMGGAIEDDPTSRDVIDWAIHGCDDFVAVT